MSYFEANGQCSVRLLMFTNVLPDDVTRYVNEATELRCNQSIKTITTTSMTTYVQYLPES